MPPSTAAWRSVTNSTVRVARPVSTTAQSHAFAANAASAVQPRSVTRSCGSASDSKPAAASQPPTGCAETRGERKHIVSENRTSTAHDDRARERMSVSFPAAVRAFACFVVWLSLTSAARAQSLHYGMNTVTLPPRMADKMVELGAGTVRLAFGWDVIEGQCKGCFDWTVTDAWRDEARRTHRTLVAALAYAPRWANGGNPYWSPPLNYQDWYDFVFAVVSRYRNDIVFYGIWNEPDLDGY